MFSTPPPPPIANGAKRCTKAATGGYSSIGHRNRESYARRASTAWRALGYGRPTVGTIALARVRSCFPGGSRRLEGFNPLDGWERLASVRALSVGVGCIGEDERLLGRPGATHLLQPSCASGVVAHPCHAIQMPEFGCRFKRLWHCIGTPLAAV